MRKTLALFALIALAAIVVLFLRREPAPIAVEAPTTAHPAEKTSAPIQDVLAAPSATAETTRATAPVAAAPVVATAEAKPAQPSTMCELRGKFTLEGGAPASGVALSVMGWGGNNERVMKYGAPEKWEQPTGTSAADGGFSMRFDPPRAFQFVLSAKLAGWCEASWRWSEIAPGSTVDVGTVELVRGGSIRGRIVDAKGHVLSKDWMVYAKSSNGDHSTDREATQVMAWPDATTGEYLLEGVPPGSVRLKAYSRIANWIEGPIVVVRAGEESKSDIQYTGPDNESRIVVIPFCRPFYVFESDPAEILLSAPGFETRRAKKIEHSSQSFSFEDVPRGSYTVEVRDPLFEPWSKSGVQPGTSVNAQLKGSAAISLQVIDDSGQPAHGYALDVRFDNVGFSPSSFRVLEASQTPPANGRFDGMIPHDQTLIVRAEGYAPIEVPVPALTAGETRAVSARLSHGGRIAGRVVAGEQKTPFAGARVVLAPERKNKSSDGFVDADAGIDTQEQVSDEQGRFAFAVVSAGDWEVSASRGPLFKAQRTLTIAVETPVANVEIALPAPGYLSGKLFAPEGASFDGLHISAMPATKDQREAREMQIALFLARDQTAVPISPTGTFRIGPLPAGDISVSLSMPKILLPHENGSSSMEGPTIDLGTAVLSADGDTFKEFDVRSEFPGTIAVRARVNGAPAASHVVEIAENQGDRSTVGVIQLDAHGSGRSGPIKPGTYSFYIRPLDGAWVDKASEQHTLQTGQSIEFELDVVLVEGTLHIADAITSAPIVNSQVSLLYSEVNSFHSVFGMTDANGNAKLALPMARYRILAGNDPGIFPSEGAPEVDWTAGGPIPAAVKIKPFEFPK